MPTVWREHGFRFFFWSEERNEPPHIHVQLGSGYAKMWLGPPVVLAKSRGFSTRELRTVLEIVNQQRAMMEKKWHDHLERKSSKYSGPDLSPRASGVSFGDGTLVVDLVDGRQISAPVAWFPRLAGAVAGAHQAELENWLLIGEGIGIHWPDLDEDISVENLLANRSELLTYRDHPPEEKPRQRQRRPRGRPRAVRDPSTGGSGSSATPPPTTS